MRNKLLKIALVASVLLALAFTISCSEIDEAIDNLDNSSSSGKKVSSSSRDNGSSSSRNNSSSSAGFNENSQIYTTQCDYIDDEVGYECGFVAYTESGYLWEWRLEQNAGTVTNGKVKLELPSSVPANDYYEPLFDDEDIAEYCTEYTNGLKIYKSGVDFRGSKDGEDYIGELSIQNEDYGFIEYWYSSKNGNIKCSYSYDGGYYSSEMIYDLTVKAGWNPVYRKYTASEDDDYLVTEYSTKNILTKEVKWIFSWGEGGD